MVAGYRLRVKNGAAAPPRRGFAGTVFAGASAPPPIGVNALGEAVDAPLVGSGPSGPQDAAPRGRRQAQGVLSLAAGGLLLWIIINTPRRSGTHHFSDWASRIAPHRHRRLGGHLGLLMTIRGVLSGLKTRGIDPLAYF